MSSDVLKLRMPWDVQAEREGKPAWFKKQWEFYEWQPDGKVSVEAILGSWGFGKTTVAARKFLHRCCQNGWTEAYGNDQPKAAICAPTYKVLHEATIPKFKAACPKELIKKERGLPSPYIELKNGIKILLVSAEGSLEGMDLCVMWIDEISDSIFSSHPQKYINYISRLRDPHSPQMSMIVSGLPLAGWVRENFDFEPDDPNHLCIRGGTQDNPFLPEATKQQMLESCPAGFENVLMSGDWGLPIGATFPMFDSSTHIKSYNGEPEQPVHLGIDIGNHGAIVVGQMVQAEKRNIVGQSGSQEALHIVDHVLTEFESLERAIYRFKTETPWQIVPGMSKIMVDPTTRRDEMQVLRRHFPGVHVVKRDRKDQYYDVNNGLEHMRVCLKDAIGNVRLTFNSKLERIRFGIVEAIQQARGNPQTGALYIKDDSRDHVICATRYMCCELLSAPRTKARII